MGAGRKETRMVRVAIRLMLAVVLAGCATAASRVVAHDPGPRFESAAVGEALPGLAAGEMAFFLAGRETFRERADVARGLGPRFNLDSCAGCHNHPAVGGTSPLVNPQIAMAREAGATNVVPTFIGPSSPVREARFKLRDDGTRDGGVHNLFTIAGRADAPGCRLAQPDFERELGRGNVSLRIPSPLFGAGLIEAIPDHRILAQWTATAAERATLGIGGRPNRGPGTSASAGDGGIARLGWKAQTTSLLFFAGEAYNVEQGVTNALFPFERDGAPGCRFNATPEDRADPAADSLVTGLSDIQRFTDFMRFLAPPREAPPTASSVRGRELFGAVGCALCHTPVLSTEKTSSPALSEQAVVLYSDLLLHRMGPGLADDVVQGGAGGDEFRTAPLWGLGQRLFFLHDGRTRDLIEAIQAHASPKERRVPASEANAVVERYRALTPAQQQDLLNFLRSL
jgi:CxxC motif-containing protein (DUF1111 family)